MGIAISVWAIISIVCGVIWKGFTRSEWITVAGGFVVVALVTYGR